MSGGITPNNGLPLSLVVNATTSLTPIGASTRNFGAVMLVGTTGTPLTTSSRIRMYSNITEVLVDFPAGTPEAARATIFFDQVPQPNLLYIGYWDNATETLTVALEALMLASTNWYIAEVLDANLTTPLVVADATSAAQAISAANPSRLLVFTSNDASILTSTQTDIAYAMSQGKYSRVLTNYNSTGVDTGIAMMGIAATTNFNGSNTTQTLMFKSPVGVPAEDLTTPQNAALAGKNANAVVTYNNGSTFYQTGVMADGNFFDTVQGADWLANAIQIGQLNALIQNPKLPQTDSGVNALISAVTAVLHQAVTNGYVAPGIWNGPAFGSIVTGQQLTTGYYIYVQPINTQTETTRQERIAPPMQIAVKLAGAIQSVSVLININQ
ncbi:MAG: DUF3383 family protein [Gallionella sp.]|nr:DUF3383 family protein [Gallionella sp.]MDD4958387.1 DUF3383 family protein [Gallionella sp.]